MRDRLSGHGGDDVGDFADREGLRAGGRVPGPAWTSGASSVSATTAAMSAASTKLATPGFRAAASSAVDIGEVVRRQRLMDWPRRTVRDGIGYRVPDQIMATDQGLAGHAEQSGFEGIAYQPFIVDTPGEQRRDLAHPQRFVGDGQQAHYVSSRLIRLGDSTGDGGGEFSGDGVGFPTGYTVD